MTSKLGMLVPDTRRGCVRYGTVHATDAPAVQEPGQSQTCMDGKATPEVVKAALHPEERTSSSGGLGERRGTTGSELEEGAEMRSDVPGHDVPLSGCGAPNTARLRCCPDDGAHG